MNAAKGRKDEIAAVTADELRSQLVLRKLVGKGGFAAVYVGTYKGEEVAVKVILAEHVSPESLQVKLLLREGQYMSRCTHKNIVKCHAVCQLPADFPGIEGLGHRSSTWALVLEYIGGGSLAALMMKQMSQTRRAYTDYEAYCWVRDVAEALSYLHNAPRPVMHRDVKADNVLLTTDEEGRPTAKLMDFGLMAALDGKNPMLRRRSVSAGPGAEGLGRSSTASIGRVSVGGGRNLTAPSVATYYNDSSHEPGKIFYLMEELPAPTVAALACPAALRRVSVDFGAFSPNGGGPPLAVTMAATAAPGGGGGATSTGGGAGTPGGTTSPTTQFGFTAVASRGSSFDGAVAAAGGGVGPAAGAAATAAGGLPWSASKQRSGAASTLPGSFGTLVPLNEEASYHGNTAGYAAMLLQQQQQRRQQQQRKASQEVAAATVAAAAAAAAGGGGGSFNGRAPGATSSLPNSLHGNTRSGSCSGGSPPNGNSSVGACSPATSAQWQCCATQADASLLTPGSVRLRLVSEEAGGSGAPGTASGDYGGGGSSVSCGGGDAAIAAAAARLGRQVSEKNGSLVRMSAPQPTLMSQPPVAPLLSEDGSPLDDAADEILRETSCFPAAAGVAPAGRHSLQLEPPQHLEQRVSRPSSANRLPPIIAVAKPRPSTAGPDEGVTPREASVGSASAPSAAAGLGPFCSPASAPHNHNQLHNSYLFNGTPGGGGGGGVVQPRPSHEAVPLVGVDSLGAEALSRRASRTNSAIATTPPQAAAPISGGVHAQVVTPGPPVAAGAMTPPAGRFDRQSSQKSVGSTRSGTGNAVDGGAQGPGGGGGGSAHFSIASLLQGRYEQDFQWVWRLTGQTGSCMYMAPEVYRNMPYNEKVDVFSFGVLLYEVFSRQLLLVSALNLRELRLKGMDTPEGYAQTVAEGYRPPKPLAMLEPLYELISACWADDPCARPNMADVVESLRLLQEQYAPQPSGSAPACGCTIS